MPAVQPKQSSSGLTIVFSKLVTMTGNRRLPTENNFRELQPIDLLCGNDHHLKPLENARCEMGMSCDAVL